MIATDKVARRKLRFESIQDLREELDRIEAADHAGRLRVTGNWTAGQILSHVAAWIEYGYDGFPLKPPPFFIRWLIRLSLPRVLKSGLKPGVRIPGVEGGTTGADKMETLAAIERLRAALRRLENGEAAKFHSPAFGEMSEEDRITLHLRHAELHLSFLAID